MNAILHLDVVQSTEAKFQWRTPQDRVLDDSVFYLIVKGGVATTRAVLNSQLQVGKHHRVIQK